MNLDNIKNKEGIVCVNRSSELKKATVTIIEKYQIEEIEKQLGVIKYTVEYIFNKIID